MPTEIIIIIQAFQKLNKYTRLQLECALDEYKSSKASKIDVHFSVICVR